MWWEVALLSLRLLELTMSQRVSVSPQMGIGQLWLMLGQGEVTHCFCTLS